MPWRRRWRYRQETSPNVLFNNELPGAYGSVSLVILPEGRVVDHPHTSKRGATGPRMQGLSYRLMSSARLKRITTFPRSCAVATTKVAMEMVARMFD